jgi:hypothetical protein
MAKKAIPAPFRPDKTALNNFDPVNFILIY